MSDWEFDPDNIRPFAERFMTELMDYDETIISGGHKYNAFVFMNDEREVLDWTLGDIDWQWPYEDRPEPENIWDGVFSEAPEGTTHVIGVHGHTEHEPIGPCNLLENLATDFATEAESRGLKAPAFVVMHGERLDGTMFIENNKAGLDGLLQNLLGRVEQRPDIDPVVGKALKDALGALREGREADHELMDDAIDSLMEQLGIESRDEIPPLELLLPDLPTILQVEQEAKAAQPLDVNKLPPLPAFDPYDPTTWRN